MGTLPDAIKKLIHRFDENAARYRSPDDNETQVRIDSLTGPAATEGRLRYRL